MANQVAYGFMNLLDRFGELVDNVGIRTISDAINVTAEEYNRQLNATLRFFVRPVTDIKLRYRVPGTARNQPLDENGRARPIKQAGHYDVAFPIATSGSAWGATFLERAKMTVQDANDTINLLLLGDRVWMRDKILASLFASTAWTSDDEDHGTLTISTLANGDATSYPFWNGGAFGSTDNHFKAQAAAIADAANPFPAIYEELKEHPENTGDVVALIPTNLKASVQGLTTFTDLPDPNLDIPNATRLVGRPGMDLTPGTLLGYEASGVFIAEWQSLPDNYIVAVATGAERVLGMREDPVASLRGFRQVATREDHPFWESQWFRRAGFGVWNRLGAVIQRIGNGTYAPPVVYANPNIY